MIVIGNFQTFDYGYLGNYERYKQPTPVQYNMKKITAPIALIYANNDAIVMKSVSILFIIKFNLKEHFVKKYIGKDICAVLHYI